MVHMGIIQPWGPGGAHGDNYQTSKRLLTIYQAIQRKIPP